VVIMFGEPVSCPKTNVCACKSFRMKTQVIKTYRK
jgi:hypothetical protein